MTSQDKREYCMIVRSKSNALFYHASVRIPLHIHIGATSFCQGDMSISSHIVASMTEIEQIERWACEPPATCTATHTSTRHGLRVPEAISTHEYCWLSRKIIVALPQESPRVCFFPRVYCCVRHLVWHMASEGADMRTPSAAAYCRVSDGDKSFHPVSELIVVVERRARSRIANRRTKAQMTLFVTCAIRLT